MSFESTVEERVGVDGADRWTKTVPHHTSGSQTEKARLPNWARVLCIAAALVVVERTCRCESVPSYPMGPAGPGPGPPSLRGPQTADVLIFSSQYKQ